MELSFHDEHKRHTKQLILKWLKIKNGDGEIRTHGGIAPTQPFQDCTLNLSDTSPHVSVKYYYIINICFVVIFFYD